MRQHTLAQQGVKSAFVAHNSLHVWGVIFLRKRVFLLLLQTLYSRAPLRYPDTHCHPPTPPLYSRETGDARASAEFTASKTSCATALWNVTESCCTANENHFVVAQVLWS